MADHGIMFSAPMVAALIAGRKTQTRRLSTSPLRARVKAGDRLWVRESFRFFAVRDDCRLTYADGRLSDHGPADGTIPEGQPLVGYFKMVDKSHKLGAGFSVPSIHMPRWASRLTLHVEAVKLEHLGRTSEEDAIAEGLAFDAPYWWVPGHPETKHGRPVQSYRMLWDSLHHKPSERWEDNPFVVAFTFRVERRNIDR